MDYKKIFRSRKSRIRILRALSFVPDKLMLKLQYRIKMGRKLNLNDPKRYSEKLQWYKLFYRDPVMSDCADKYEVRKFVAQRGLEDILNPLYGVYDTPAEIDWDTLPNSFVIKDTLGGGGNSVIIVDDKTKCDIAAIKARLNEWVNTPITRKNTGREWVYDHKKHRIIIEKNLFEYGIDDLPDYKFFCFNGEPYCLYLMRNYARHHDEGELGFLTPDFKLMKACRKDFAPMMNQPEKPEGFEEMVQMTRKLASGFPHVRVDFYNISGKIIFGEMTFFNASGYVAFEPDSFDFEMGEKFVLPQRTKTSKNV